MNPLKGFRNWLSNLPHKKQYIELLTAVLSVPVLLTVVYMNYLSIQEKRHKDELTPTPTPPQSVVTIIKENDNPTPRVSESDTECNPEIGPITIVNPEENASESDNPLEIDIQYTKGTYCSVVWSYRINASNWSEYNDNDIQIYNMPSGEKTLELRVKSIVSGQEKKIIRTFKYTNNQEVATPTNSPTATPTPTPSPTSGVTISPNQ